MQVRYSYFIAFSFHNLTYYKIVRSRLNDRSGPNKTDESDQTDEDTKQQEDDFIRTGVLSARTTPKKVHNLVWTKK